MPTPQIPQHVAIIMDGNGRWAQKRGRPRVFGHIRGSARVKPIVKEANRLGIKALTLYAFSTENWNRPESERAVLWKLLRKYLVKETPDLHRENVRLSVIGEIDKLDSDTRKVLDESICKLSGNTGLKLNFAVSYGSRAEILRATKLFADDCLSGRRKPEEMNEKLFNEYLWTAGLGELSDVDLVIRTSGEKRVSNFVLWQAAYAEYLFLEHPWPEFSESDLARAVEDFGKRERRFGGIGAPQAPTGRTKKAEAGTWQQQS